MKSDAEVTSYALRYLADDCEDHRPLMAARMRQIADLIDGVKNTGDVCTCPRFRDLPAGTIIADLTCPVHGVNGTDPGDVLPPDTGDTA